MSKIACPGTAWINEVVSEFLTFQGDRQTDNADRHIYSLFMGSIGIRVYKSIDLQSGHPKSFNGTAKYTSSSLSRFVIGITKIRGYLRPKWYNTEPLHINETWYET